MHVLSSHKKISYQKVILLSAGALTVFLMILMPNPPYALNAQGPSPQTPQQPNPSTQTESQNKATEGILQRIEGCGFADVVSGNIFSFECIAGGLANMSQGILSVVGWLLTFSAILFDEVKDIALDAKTYNSIDVVKTGWTSVRNVANIFFIFILLLIAIATILRIETYGVKQLLLRFIIIALFINFSYTITLYIILPANSLAEFFVTNTFNNPEFAPYKDSRAMVGAFIQGIKPAVYFKQDHTFLREKIETYNDVQKQIEKQDVSKTENKLQTALYVLAATFLGIILILFTAFILLMAGFLLLVRIAVLWMLMIFSPLAFLFMILPKTKGIASEWWSKLISQSLFPAAFLFLFSIVVSIGASDQVRRFIFDLQKNNEGANIINFIAIYVILLILLYLSLYIAQRFGAYGANTAMGWAGSLQKFATGAMIGAGAYVGYKTAGKAARFTESMIGEERMSQIRTLPIIGGFTRPMTKGLEKLGAMGKREEAEKERLENLKKLSPDMLADRFFGSTYAEQAKALQDKEIAKRLGQTYEKMPAEKQAKLDAIVKSQGFALQSETYRNAPKLFAKALVDGEMRKDVRQEVMRQADKETLQKIANTVEKTNPDQARALVAETRDIDKRQAEYMATVLPHYFKEAGFADIAPAIKNIDFEYIDKNTLAGLEKISYQEKDASGKVMTKTIENALAYHATPSQRQRILFEGGDAADIYLTQMTNLAKTPGVGDTPEDIARALNAVQNRAAANKFRSNDKVFLGLHNPEWVKKVSSKTKGGASFPTGFRPPPGGGAAGGGAGGGTTP